ncbi:hypothetical protein LLG96_15630 [bacterium]|nr:hypothetical protein [bacterium]
MSLSLKRRHFFGSLFAGGLGAVMSRMPGDGNAHATEAETRPFWEQYYTGAMNILTGLYDTQTEIIEREMKTALERTKKGGTIYSQITSGHFPIPETALDRTGQPGVFAFLERGAKDEDYTKLGPNDMIITNTINLGNIAAMKRGIRVVGVTVNYYPFAQTPPEEGYQIEYEGKILRIEDTVNAMIDSQVPWYNGLVRTPRNPDFAIIPGGGLAQAAVYWTAAAELAGLKADKGKNPESGGWARFYLQTCIERAAMVGADRPKFAAVGSHLADLVVRGGKWWVFGANKALVTDASSVANGPMVTRPYTASAVKSGDIVLIGAYTSNHPEELAVARESRSKGAYVIAICPFSTDGDSSGERLYKEADVAFNSYSPESWGVVPVKGLDRRVCPTTGVMGDLIMWLIVAEWTDVMAQRGPFPYFWKGFFMKNGQGYNNSIRPYFTVRGW